MTTRRNFMGAMLGMMAAPAIVRAESLMKIFVPPPKKIILPDYLLYNLKDIYLTETLTHNVSADFAEAVMNQNQALMDRIGKMKLLVEPQYYQDEIDLQTLIKNAKDRQAIVANKLVDDLINQYRFMKAQA